MTISANNQGARRRLTASVLLGLVASLAMAGCGSGNAKPPEVTWAGRLCDHLADNGSKITMPAVDLHAPRPTQKAVARFLTQVATQMHKLAGDMKRDGAPPVHGGKASYDAAMASLKQTSSAVEEARHDLEAAKVTDAESLSAALALAGKGLSKFSAYGGPAKDFRTNPKLKAAFDKSPACQKISEPFSSRP